MVEPATSLHFPLGNSATEPLPRCCPQHADWATLTQHLVDEFPEIGIRDLVREVRRAKHAVEAVSMEPDEAVEIGELIARHQLLLRSGQVEEVARLDPERHTQRT